MVRYILPSVEGLLQLERRCPRCQRHNGRVHSGLRHRSISDLKVRTIPQRRMKCPWCQATWTVRTPGVLPGHHRSRRLEGTGAKYHADGCRYLSKSKIPITLKEAKARYTPCSVCRPPQ